jgi:dTDP-glucose pyrophosphorylase
MYEVFISYSTEDGHDLAKSVSTILKTEFLIDAYVAEREARHGTDISDGIKKAINQSRKVLIIFTPKALNSKWVKAEESYAQNKEKDIIVCVKEGIDINDLPIRTHKDVLLRFKDNDELCKTLKKEEWGIPVIIPTAGKGSGLYPLTFGMPKTLFPVREKPILHHIISSLEDSNYFSRIIIITGKFHDMIEYYVSMIKDTKITIECRKATGNTLPMSLKNMQLKTTFMVYFSDIIIEGSINWNEFINYHKSNRRDHDILGTLMTSKRHKIPVGRVTPDNKFPHLIGTFEEKPDDSIHSYSFNMAVSIFEAEFLDFVKSDDKSLFGDTYANAAKDGKRFTYFGHDEWLHIQTLNDWYNVQKSFF